MHTFKQTASLEHFYTLMLNSKGQEVAREYNFSRPVEACDCGCKQTRYGKSVQAQHAEGKVVVLGITRI